MELEHREQLIVAAACLLRPDPEAPQDRITANCGKVIAQALVWAGLWTEEIRFHMHGDEVDPIVDEWYRSLIAMTLATASEMLLEGFGNLGSPAGDPPAAPTFTACRLTRGGWTLATKILADHALQRQPREFFKGL